MPKLKSIKISQLMEVLVNQLEKGETEVTLCGYIADSMNCDNLFVSDKEAFSEQSYAEWQLERNGY